MTATTPCAALPHVRRQTLDRPYTRSPASLGFQHHRRLERPGAGLNDRVPYTLPLSIVGDYASISTGTDRSGGMPDPVRSGVLPWPPNALWPLPHAVIATIRWLIDYFADNELAWAGPGDDPKARYALAYGTLKMTDRCARQMCVPQAIARQVPAMNSRRARASPRSPRRCPRRAWCRPRSASRRRACSTIRPSAGSFGLSGLRSQTMSRCPWRTSVGADSRPGVAGTRITRLRAGSLCTS